MSRKRIVAHGRVQGVSFRAYAEQEARRLNLRGWARNRADGRRVEMLVEGDDPAVERFLAWCAQGSPAAHVERVELEDDASAEPLPAPFEVRATA